MTTSIDPRSAAERLKAEPGSIYLDVRSEGEYAQGHPEGAWNLPIQHATALGMRPNHDFLDVAKHVLPADVLIVVGCKSGQRSMMACQALEQAGFTKVVNMAGGFGGSAGTPGWASLGLPSTTSPTPGYTWEDLRTQT